jgi:group I intron endonuclease
LEILEYCEPSNVIAREQYYLDLLNPEYNISLTACAPMTGRNHSEETKQKMSEVKLGILRSEDTRRRISEAKKGMTKTEGSGSPSVPIEVLDLDTGIKTVYPSMSEVARALGAPNSSISVYVYRNTKKPYRGRYKIYVQNITIS